MGLADRQLSRLSLGGSPTRDTINGESAGGARNVARPFADMLWCTAAAAPRAASAAALLLPARSARITTVARTPAPARMPLYRSTRVPAQPACPHAARPWVSPPLCLRRPRRCPCAPPISHPSLAVTPNSAGHAGACIRGSGNRKEASACTRPHCGPNREHRCGPAQRLVARHLSSGHPPQGQNRLL